MQVQAYLFFSGNCEEAIRFYGEALGARVDMLMRYKDSPEPPPPGMVPPGFDDKVMHAAIRIGESVVMLSDDCTGQARFGGFSLSVAAADAAEAARLFAALSDGGDIQMPLGPTFWSPAFGMLTDRFGVGWMVNVADGAAG